MNLPGTLLEHAVEPSLVHLLPPPPHREEGELCRDDDDDEVMFNVLRCQLTY